MAVFRGLRQRGVLQPDPAQQLAIERLQSLYRALLHYRPETGLRGWLARFGLAENTLLKPRVTPSIPELGLEHVVDGEIGLS